MAPPNVARYDFHILPVRTLTSRSILENGLDTTNMILIAVASILGAATLLFLIALVVYRRRLARHRMIESQFVAVQRKNDHFNHDSSAPNSPSPSGFTVDVGEDWEKRLSTIQEEGTQGAEAYTYPATRNTRSPEGALQGMPTTMEELRRWGEDARRVFSVDETPGRRSTDIGLQDMSRMRRDEHGFQGRSLTTRTIGTAISC